MRVQEVMTKDVQTVTAAMPAEDAWNLMRLKRIRHLVVTQGRRIVGILSDRDAGGREGETIRDGRTVGDLMTAAVVTVPSTTTMRKAANLMRGHTIGCVVVADAGKVAGIVTTSDLLDLLGRGIVRPVATTTRWTLKHRAPHKKQHGAAGVW
jgi:acetoin utilization protein AcuB